MEKETLISSYDEINDTFVGKIGSHVLYGFGTLLWIFARIFT